MVNFSCVEAHLQRPKALGNQKIRQDINIEYMCIYASLLFIWLSYA
jgi:hypothetical protein